MKMRADNSVKGDVLQVRRIELIKVPQNVCFFAWSLQYQCSVKPCCALLRQDACAQHSGVVRTFLAEGAVRLVGAILWTGTHDIVTDKHISGRFQFCFCFHCV
jgi:hypothetical protein